MPVRKILGDRRSISGISATAGYYYILNQNGNILGYSGVHGELTKKCAEPLVRHMAIDFGLIPGEYTILYKQGKLVGLPKVFSNSFTFTVTRELELSSNGQKINKEDEGTLIVKIL
jgi:hypothetical protein